MKNENFNNLHIVNSNLGVVIRNKIYRIFFKKGKQYHFKLSYITYWGCDSYHWLRVHKNSWISILNNRINGYCLITVNFQ
jgi:hypothetical protein